MKILAIDPGPALSQFVLWDAEKEGVMFHELLANDAMLARIPYVWCFADQIVIEGVACYGMAVGKEVFDTCIWIGRFLQQVDGRASVLYRKDVKMNLCQSMKAKDANIRQALIDRFGQVGTKKAPGKLYGISGHAWAALALAVTWADKQKVKAA